MKITWRVCHTASTVPARWLWGRLKVSGTRGNAHRRPIFFCFDSAMFSTVRASLHFGVPPLRRASTFQCSPLCGSPLTRQSHRCSTNESNAKSRSGYFHCRTHSSDHFRPSNKAVAMSFAVSCEPFVDVRLFRTYGAQRFAQCFF